ncbi:NAD(P)H-dependent glycerol-3-phosphate dehydrogenase [Chamaesiphon polymorphus]|uniref:Glycerol-3-phosphate dehydrogenase [NAD(P)+] n=1 Tax=Chamaesiphon polymorphus CCALA 037 TaxID=2107692 RepID=A0A2T1GBV7_9CYAN|nr:NAD(P)H-dependent glycerol-3-phosphate dehydrogenase [Chamaesiphon polymorphus]PSB54828.1 NAD(P)H-dependent glycerol-3-phosphate dehydrogenase [Chamaesiphon polymorphus CCALA 037]
MNDRIIIIGAGAWGDALSKLTQINGCEPTIWSRSCGRVLSEMITDRVAIISAVSMSGVPAIIDRLHGAIEPNQIIVTATKGLDARTNLTPAQLWHQAFPNNPIVVLSGPNLSLEIQQGLPAATVVASHDVDAANTIQTIFSSPKFRVYTNDDPIGVELGGTIKNVIAIAAGTCDGLKLGDNAKSALLTRGLAEIIRIGQYWGGKPETFYGLSGLGDLLTTCNSPLSRNYQVGYGLAQGQTLSEVLANLKGTAEGVNTTKVLIQIADSNQIYMPITVLVDRLLQGQITAPEAIVALMSRDRKSE